MKMIDVGSFVRVSLINRGGELVLLDIVCDTKLPGLWQLFNTGTEIKNYIIEDTDNAYKKALQRLDTHHYIINCEMPEGELIISREKWEKRQGQKIQIYMPIIQKFMADAFAACAKV